MTDQQKARETTVTSLFAAWSSGDIDAPRQYLTDSPVLEDSVNGRYEGWPAMRDFFAHALTKYPDFVLEPTGEFWHRLDGLAFTWTLSATQTDSTLGEEYVGRRFFVPGMSYIVFEGDRISFEVDYHDNGAKLRSLKATSA